MEAAFLARLSWRVPHEPQRKNFEVYTPSSPNKRSTGGSPSKKQPSQHTISTQQRLWSSLFAEVNHAVDALYAACEQYADQSKCSEAVDTFERCRLDFDQLIVRIEEQRRFELDQSGGIAWDVRKPVHPPEPLLASSPSPQMITPSQSVYEPDAAPLTVQIPPLPMSVTSIRKKHSTPSPVEKELWLEEVEREIRNETEAAWAEAEELVDLESAKEDHEWRKLSFGGDDSDGSISPEPSPLDRHSSSGSISSLGTPSPADKLPRYRMLHDKLSTATNSWKTMSTTEARERHLARQQTAERNRAQNESTRKMKLSLASDRARQRASDRARERSLAEQAWEDKLREGERRREEYIKSRRERAGNESLKVSEIQFINTLNEEELKDQLQTRLNDIESRFQAASLRRQQHLESISGKQKKYHNHKTQQMSALRLRIETERMERWNRLKARIEAVQQRREQRLQEMQRRAVDAAVLPSEEPIEEETEAIHEPSKKKKMRRKKTYSQQIRYVLQNWDKFAMDSSNAGLVRLATPALDVLSSLAQKENVRSIREALRTAFISTTGSSWMNKQESLEGYLALLATLETAEQRRGALRDMSAFLEMVLYPRSTSSAMFPLAAWRATWASLDTLAEDEETLLQLPATAVIDSASFVLTCWTLYTAQDGDLIDGELFALDHSLHSVLHILHTLLETWLSKATETNPTTLFQIVSYVFSSGLVFAATRAIESLLVLCEYSASSSHLDVFTRLMACIARLISSIAHCLGHGATPTLIQSADQAFPLAHPKGREWVNVLNSTKCSALLMRCLEYVSQGGIDSSRVADVLAAFLALQSVDPVIIRYAVIDTSAELQLLCSLERCIQGTHAGEAAAEKHLFLMLRFLGLVVLAESHADEDLQSCLLSEAMLVSLCELPLRFFVDAPHADTLLALFVILVAVSPHAEQVLRQHVHPSFVTKFVECLLHTPDSERTMRITRHVPLFIAMKALQTLA